MTIKINTESRLLAVTYRQKCLEKPANIGVWQNMKFRKQQERD